MSPTILKNKKLPLTRTSHKLPAAADEAPTKIYEKCRLNLLIGLCGFFLCLCLFNISCQQKSPNDFPDEIQHAQFDKEGFRVATFNIRLYGSQKENKTYLDQRDQYLKKFLSTYMETHDVLIFQEILNKKRFQEKIIGSRMSCVSYDHSAHKHQYIVICARQGLHLEPFRGDDDYQIESVAISYNLRPAVHAQITQGSQVLAYVIGVHLKAGINDFWKRNRQMELLTNHLVNEKPIATPTILVGDFNSFENELNHYENLFYSMNLSLRPLRFSDFTYNNGVHKSQFDHIWLSHHLKALESPSIDGICNNFHDNKKLDFYNYYISDHCPVSVTLGH